jgi:hypothetical protein
MDQLTQKRLVAQGYDQAVINSTPGIMPLTKWTPLACATAGLAGVLLKSSEYLIVLGVCTSIGAFTNRSFFDLLYRYIFSHVFRLGEMPEHGIQRRIGCGIGACMFIISGSGFYIGNPYMAYIPSCFMVIFAYIAGIFNWCFVSTFYALACGKNKNECCGTKGGYDLT